jgi:hypothetical protein
VSKDKVMLSVPAKPDYIVAVRLLVSAIAQRADFSLDDIEDMKVASAEGCTILQIIVDKGIHVCLTAIEPKGKLDESVEISELSQYLLEALVDKCDIVRDGEIVNSINIYKN